LIVRPREVGLFTLIGTTGTVINLAVVTALVPRGIAPLLANVLGFLISFAWCFYGHGRWTFPAVGRDVSLALRRFAMVSLASFALTELVYAGMLRWTTIDYRLSLYLAILTVAVGKLLASKHWAFARG
jgi:putative flippase GtrA